MNQLQQVEFNLLKSFDAVCAELDLPYFLVCGSALGAVKYEGFIPWDDDIDVAMYRDDYRAFVKHAPGLLEEGLFLQNYRSDPRFPQIYSKLRDSRTTYIESSAAALPINHGVFIDIFPLDGYPKRKWSQKVFEIRKRMFQSMLLSAYEIPRSGKSKLLHKMYCMLDIPFRSSDIASRYEAMISSYPIAHSELICNHGNWQGKLEYAGREQYGDGAHFAFEGLNVRVPREFDIYLTQKYGEWRSDPPLEKQVGHHYCDVCDCSKSYKEYMRNGVICDETCEG